MVPISGSIVKKMVGVGLRTGLLVGAQQLWAQILWQRQSSSLTGTLRNLNRTASLSTSPITLPEM